MYHLCCMCYHLFRKDSKNASHCPDCQHPRFNTHGKPNATFVYRTLSAYVRRLFANHPGVAGLLDWHARPAARLGPDGSIADTVDSWAHRAAFSAENHNKDPRHLLLSE